MDSPYRQELLQYLNSLYPKKNIVNLTRIPEAITTVAYNLDSGENDDLIVKVAIDEKDIAEGKGKKEILAIEKAKKALKGTMEVPDIMHFEENVPGFPGYITIMRKSDGSTTSADWLNTEGTSKENIETLVKAVNSLHSITSANVSDLAQFEAEKGSDYLEKYIRKAETKLAGSEIYEKIEPTIEHLKNNVGIFNNDKYPFIHRDIKHNNILVNNNRVSAIIDWETALFVPASMEFAHISVLARVYGYEKWIKAFIERYLQENPTAFTDEEFELAEVFVALRFFMRSSDHSLSMGLSAKLANSDRTEGDLYMEYLTKRN